MLTTRNNVNDHDQNPVYIETQVPFSIKNVTQVHLAIWLLFLWSPSPIILKFLMECQDKINKMCLKK